MNHRTFSKLTASALTLFALAAPAFAADGAEGDDVKARIAKRVDGAFTKLDINKDGKISRDEASKGPRMSKKFDKIDADHDGFVTRDELSAAIARHVKR